MARLLKGAEVTAALNERIAARAAALRERGVVPTLGIVRVGERPDDLSYERGAVKRVESLEVAAERFTLPADATQVRPAGPALSEQRQRPHPRGCCCSARCPSDLDEDEILQYAGRRRKDIDGITDLSAPGCRRARLCGLRPLHTQRPVWR
jgi:methylenetetrahydrofolate dehydrogenase (NADP+)/methenyltetrahydrofolate cyclohydrolase